MTDTKKNIGLKPVMMKNLPDFHAWEKLKGKRVPVSFDLELTARCNNNCRHCFINLPAGDKTAEREELSYSEIERIADEAVSMGAFWCLITGGEPLLREDFFDLYVMLKKKGLLVSLFSNATLITKRHIELFKKYPPRDIEVSVYGTNEKTYEKVTRKSGSYIAFKRGLDLLLDAEMEVILKVMALRSNIGEVVDILRFCRQRSASPVRFDPFLHLRYDGDAERNKEIKSERLSPREIVRLEKSDNERFHSLEKDCDKLISHRNHESSCRHLFHCAVGMQNFVVGHNGYFRLCMSLNHPDFVYNMRKGHLKDIWNHFVPKVLEAQTQRLEFHERCHRCNIVNLCMWCPAHAYLETGELDLPVEYFCEVARLRAEMLRIT